MMQTDYPATLNKKQQRPGGLFSEISRQFTEAIEYKGNKT